MEICNALLSAISHLVNCSDAKETIRSNYNNLTNLSIDSILDKLYAKKIITLTEKEKIETLDLRRKKMAYFLDHVIIPSLNSNFIVKFQRFLEVMNDSDDLMFINMANQLGMYVTKLYHRYSY